MFCHVIVCPLPGLNLCGKGIIFKIEDRLEGIVPIKGLSKDQKEKLLSTFKEGDTHEVTVQEVDAESKKIILMMNLELGGGKKDESEIQETTETNPEKIEIPQDIIDQISDNDNTNEESGSADTEEVDN